MEAQGNQLKLWVPVQDNYLNSLQLNFKKLFLNNLKLKDMISKIVFSINFKDLLN